MMIPKCENLITLPNPKIAIKYFCPYICFVIGYDTQYVLLLLCFGILSARTFLSSCTWCINLSNSIMAGGWVGLWGFLWWAPSAKRKEHHGSALDGAVFDIAQILAYLVHNMSRSQLYLGFGHFGWLPPFFGQQHFGGLMIKLYFLCWNYSLSSGWHIIAA